MAYWRTPLDLDNVEITHGIIHINIEQCKGCEFCVEYCPKVVLKLSTDYNRKGYHYPMVEKQGSCVNCNLCEMICPEFAIFCVEDKPRPPLKLDVLGGNERP